MKRAAFLVAAAGAAAVAVVAADRYAREWGVDPDEASGDLPGDDLVADPDRVMTHGVTIEAAPADVWPWLLQMGYGRGGWYSYDAVDMRGRSADAPVGLLSSTYFTRRSIDADRQASTSEGGVRPKSRDRYSTRVRDSWNNALNRRCSNRLSRRMSTMMATTGRVAAM